MSSTAPDTPAPVAEAVAAAEEVVPPPEPAPTLAELRAEVDRLDDALHDLLMQRAEVVTRIAALGAQGKKIAFRPGREAEIVRRLLARHQGSLPRRCCRGCGASCSPRPPPCRATS